MNIGVFRMSGKLKGDLIDVYNILNEIKTWIGRVFFLQGDMTEIEYYPS